MSWSYEKKKKAISWKSPIIINMKIAITSTGNSLESTLDQRFGRCAYFVVYSTDSKAIEFIPNPNRNAEDGAGPSSVQLIASRDVSKIVSGEFGFKIKPLLDSLKIQMIILKEPEKKIKDIIEMLNH
jgi:predicted Fe-Mo cluster-binding NifX family protein